MSVSRVATVAFAGLAGSLALNAYLLLARPDSPPPPPPVWNEPADAGAPVAEAGTPPIADAAPDGTCEQDLERCRQATWQLALKALAPAATAQGVGKLRAAKHSPTEEQAAALCDLARGQLRERWKTDQEAIVGGLRAQLADIPRLQMDFLVSVQDMATTLHLPDKDRDALAKEYLPLRAARMLALHDALEAQPPDVKGAFEATKGLIADEDALLGKSVGEEAMRRWREHQLAPRTVILAILATMADLSWDTDIGW